MILINAFLLGLFFCLSGCVTDLLGPEDGVVERTGHYRALESYVRPSHQHRLIPTVLSAKLHFRTV